MTFGKVGRKEIKHKLALFVIKGGVVLTDKTKSLYNGGRHRLSLGRNREAVQSAERYMIISYGYHPGANFDIKFLSVYDAVNWFVEFCGNDIAYDAYRAALSCKA